MPEGFFEVNSMPTNNEAWVLSDEAKWFKDDVLKEKISVEKGRMDISTFRIHNKCINDKLLEEIK